MDKMEDIAGYKWQNAERSCSHDYLLPTVFGVLDSLELKGTARGGDLILAAAMVLLRLA